MSEISLPPSPASLGINLLLSPKDSVSLQIWSFNYSYFSVIPFAVSTLCIAYMFRHSVTKNKKFLRQRQGLNAELVS